MVRGSPAACDGGRWVPGLAAWYWLREGPPLPVMGLPECPHNMAAGFPRASAPRGGKGEATLSFMTSEVTHCDFCHILWVSKVGRGMNTEGCWRSFGG